MQKKGRHGRASSGEAATVLFTVRHQCQFENPLAATGAKTPDKSGQERPPFVLS